MPSLIFRKGLELKHEVAGVLAESYHSELVQKIKASGKTTVHTPSPVELAEWRRAMQRVYDEAPSWIEKRAIDSMRLAADSGPP